MALDVHSPGGAQQVRGVLEARRSQLAEELDRLMVRIREDSSRTPGDEPAESDTSDLDVTLLELNYTMLRRIDLALERLGDGRYGRCTRCGGPIAEARLRAMPFAVRCRPCETARERSGERQASHTAKSALGYSLFRVSSITSG